MLAAQQSKSNEQNEEPQRHRHNRSPSSESVSRLHQQSGGFAQSQQQQRRSSFSKDNNSGGYYQQNNGYRRQNYNNQRGRNFQRNYQNQQDYHQNTGYGQGGYQHKPQQHQNNRSFNYNSNYQKTPFYFPNPYPGQPQPHRPIFNSTNEVGAYSARRQSPSSPPSPSSTSSSSLLTQNLQRRSDLEKTREEHEKMHNYRAAGTAPSLSNTSSPLKVPPQPPSTPSSDKRGDLPEDWHHRFVPSVQHMTSFQTLQIVQNQHRRGHDHPPPIALQHRKPTPSLPVEITSLPATPSAMDQPKFSAPTKDSTTGRSMDSVDAKHSNFADERWRSALMG